MRTPALPQISIGSVGRRPGVSAAASAEALQGLESGLATAATMAGPSGNLRLTQIAVRLRQGAGPGEIAEAVQRAIAAAVGAQRG